MSTVESNLKSALDDLGYPVYNTLNPDPPPVTFIVYQTTNDLPTYFADDDNLTNDYYFQIHIYSKGNTNSIKNALKAIKDDGFIRQGGHDMPYDKDTKYYHRVENYYYHEEV